MSEFLGHIVRVKRVARTKSIRLRVKKERPKSWAGLGSEGMVEYCPPEHIDTEEGPLLRINQYKLFRNPRGLRYHYCFTGPRTTRSGSTYSWASPDGATTNGSWTLISNSSYLPRSEYGGTSYWPGEDPSNNRLKIFCCYTIHTAENLAYQWDLGYRLLTVNDSGYGISSWGSSHSVENGGGLEYRHILPSNCQDYNGRVWMCCRHYFSYETPPPYKVRRYYTGVNPGSTPSTTKANVWSTNQAWLSAVIFPLKSNSEDADVGFLCQFDNNINCRYDGVSSGMGTTRTVTGSDAYPKGACDDDGEAWVLYKDGTTLKVVQWTIGTGLGTPTTIATSAGGYSISRNSVGFIVLWYTKTSDSPSNSKLYYRIGADGDWSSEILACNLGYGIGQLRAEYEDFGVDGITRICFATGNDAKYLQIRLDRD